MKLLILTQKVDINDDVLGFMHGWIAEFAKHCEKVTVIALGVGEYNLPMKVKVLSLGKEEKNFQFSIFNFQLKKIKYFFRFYKYIWQERRNYDAVFVHMNKEYVILGGWYWRLTGKKIALWYVHKRADFKLMLAEKLAQVIFTASPESFNLPSSKLRIIGHGIDLNKFYYSPRVRPEENFKIIYVGRISRIKNQKFLIEAINILVNQKKFKKIKVDFIGTPGYREDMAYQAKLVNFIENNQLENYINFIGSVPNKDIAQYYQRSDLSVNLCPTGGMDKAVLESMAAGLPVIVYNKTFTPLLGQFNNLMLENLNEKELADKIQALLNTPKEELNSIGLNLRKKIIDQHNLTGLVSKIISELENKYGR